MQIKSLTFGTVLVLLASCAAAPTGEQESFGPIVYPPPPDEPRFIYERTIHGSADVVTVDSETKWRRALTGERATTVAFAKPFDVDVCQGIVFVSDTVNRSVFVFDIPHGEFRQVGAEEPGVLRKPMGLATDDECNLYVADQTGRRVVKYDQQGEYLAAFGGEDVFDRLSHVAVDTARDSERRRVKVLDRDAFPKELWIETHGQALTYRHTGVPFQGWADGIFCCTRRNRAAQDDSMGGALRLNTLPDLRNDTVDCLK